ncbi:MAG TPA: aminotransferase class III-fold pyridoxal phosphate-dependent enzyme, partial [Longimicrobiales bacterium]|nr:aminotransferase class III-fold pyridoxal phosphate-dependent enzyme [Longimicrobiales bacterium]
MSAAAPLGGVASGTSTADILRAQERLLLPHMLHLYERPLVLVDAEGVRVRDAEGREYLDLFAGILTTSVGHCHPRVVAAITEQARHLGHVSTLYATLPQVEAASKLVEIAPDGLTRTFFTTSGTEAVEAALVIACVATGRSEIVALRHAYHGRSLTALALTANSGWKPLA